MEMREYKLKNIFKQKISKILALEFQPILNDADELRKFLVEATGCEDNKFKVYSNGRGGVGLICSRGLFEEDSRLNLRQVSDGYAVVFKYENGCHDIFYLDRKEFLEFFKEKNASL